MSANHSPDSSQKCNDNSTHPNPPTVRLPSDRSVTRVLEDSFPSLARAVRAAVSDYRLDAADAEDVVQEACARLLAAGHRPDNVEAYVVATAKNIARSNVTRPIARATSAGGAPELRYEFEDGAIDRVVYESAFARLSPGDQQILATALQGVEGWPAALRKRLQRARARLEAGIAGLAGVVGTAHRRFGRAAPEQLAAVVAAGTLGAASLVAGWPATPEARLLIPTPTASQAESAQRAPELATENAVAPGAAAAHPAATAPDSTTAPPTPPSGEQVVVAIPGPGGPTTITDESGSGRNELVCHASAFANICIDWPTISKP